MADNSLNEEHHMSLLQLLKLTRFFDASKDPDVIFSLLGLAHDSNDFPETDDKISTQQLYTDITKVLLRQGRVQDVLSLARVGSRDAKMPSWVIDWRTIRHTYAPRHWNLYQASSDLEDVKLDDQHPILRTKGRMVDTVVAASESMKNVTIRDSLFVTYLSVCQKAFKNHFDLSKDRYAIFKAATRVLTSDEPRSHRDKDDGGETESVHSEHSADFEMRVGSGSLPGDDWSRFLHYPVNEYKAYFQTYAVGWRAGTQFVDGVLAENGGKAATWGRKALSLVTPSVKDGTDLVMETLVNFIMKNHELRESTGNAALDETLEIISEAFTGTNPHIVLHLHADMKVILYGDHKLGFAPGTAETGDKICVIAGMPCPFLLREVQGGHQLVGACFTPGFMQGEACEDDRFPLQELSLV